LGKLVANLEEIRIYPEVYVIVLETKNHGNEMEWLRNHAHYHHEWNEQAEDR